MPDSWEEKQTRGLFFTYVISMKPGKYYLLSCEIFKRLALK